MYIYILNVFINNLVNRDDLNLELPHIQGYHLSGIRFPSDRRV